MNTIISPNNGVSLLTFVSLNQGFVLLSEGHELIVAAHFHYTTAVSLILQHANNIGIPDGAQTMSNNNGSAITAALFHQLV